MKFTIPFYNIGKAIDSKKTEIIVLISIVLYIYLYIDTIELYLSTNTVYYTISKHFATQFNLNSPWIEGAKLSINNLGLTHILYSLLFRLSPGQSQKIWELLPIILIPVAFIFQYVLAAKILKSSMLKAIFPAISLFYLEPWWIYQAQSPRFFGIFFIVAAITYILIDKKFIDLNNKKIHILGLLWSTLFYTHKLLALQSLLMFFIYISLSFNKKDIIDILKKISRLCIICALFCFPLIFLTVQELINHKLTNSYYGNYQIWTMKLFGIIDIPNYERLYFYGGHTIKYVTLSALLLGLFIRKNHLFKSMSLLIIITLFTPLGILISKLITPGVVVETFIAGSAFPVLLLIFYLFDNLRLRKSISYVIQAVIITYIFAPPIQKFVIFASTNHKNSVPAAFKDDLKKELISLNNSNILSDHKTSTYIPMVSNNKVLIADRLNILETPKYNLNYLNRFFTKNFNVSDINHLSKSFNCKSIVLVKSTINHFNKKLNDNSFTERYGLSYSETYEELIIKYREISKYSNIVLHESKRYSIIQIN